MKRKSAFTALLFSFALAVPAFAGMDFDFSTNPGSFLKSWEGSGASMGLYPCQGGVGDLNGDGIDDLVMVEYTTSTLGRSNNGAAYVMYGLHKSSGGVNVPIGSAYNLRIVGANSNDQINECWVGDFNGDGQDDLMLRSDGANELYILYGPLPNVVGQTVDLANAASFNVKYVMPSGNGNMYPFLADLNGDGIDDLFIEVPNGSFNGSNSGSLFVRYGPQPSGTGNVLDISQPANFNLRIDGSGANAYLTDNNRNGWTYEAGPTTAVGDLNGDGAPDLVVAGSNESDWGRTNNGIVYVSTGPFPVTTGNVWHTNDVGRWMVRIGGESSYADMSRAVIADFNGDGKNDLCVTTNYGNTLGRSNNGAVYCIYGPLNYPVDSELDTAISNNWNVAFMGAANSDYLGYNSLRAADLNGDGYKDLIIESEYANLGATSPGAVYIVDGGPNSGFFPPGTGTVWDFANSPSYNVRITDNQYNAHLTYAPTIIKDVDGDGYQDLILTSQGRWSCTPNCGSYVAYVAVSFGPTPSTTGNQWDLSGGNYDLRYHYSNWNTDFALTTLVGDWDGDGFQDVTFNNRYWSGAYSQDGKLYAVSTSTGMARITSPVLFTSSGVSTSLTVTWAPVSGATQYRMQLDVDPRFPSPVSDQTVSATQATVSGLVNGQSYYVHVKAVNGNFTRYGPIASFTVDNTPPTAPMLVAPPNGGSVGTQTPTFNWTDASSE